MGGGCSIGFAIDGPWDIIVGGGCSGAGVPVLKLFLLYTGSTTEGTSRWSGDRWSGEEVVVSRGCSTDHLLYSLLSGSFAPVGRVVLVPVADYIEFCMFGLTDL